MKTDLVELFRVCLLGVISFSIVILANSSFAESLEGFHIRRGVHRDYRFRDAPADVAFIKKFPLEPLLKDPMVKTVEQVKTPYEAYCLLKVAEEREESKEVRLDYWIYTSISGAEEAMVEFLDSISLQTRSAIDIDRAGVIGDNCWYAANDLVLSFTRNNVRVNVAVQSSTNTSDVASAIAKNIDTAIISAQKVSTGSLVPAPMIRSVEIVSGTPRIGKMITLKVDAVDPQAQTLEFRLAGGPLSAVSRTGYLEVPPLKLDGPYSIKILVINEDRIVASVEKEIPF